MARRRGDRRRRHLGQGGRAVFERKPDRQSTPGNRRDRAISAGGGRRMDLRENARHGLPKRVRRGQARHRNRPRRRCAGGPNRRSTHCRVRCRRRGFPPCSPIQVTFATPPMLRMASGFGSACGEGGMEQRSERRSLAARGYVGRAEIGDHIQPEPRAPAARRRRSARCGVRPGDAGSCGRESRRGRPRFPDG